MDLIQPFYLEDKQEGPNYKVPEASVNEWHNSIITNIKREEQWHKFLPTGSKPDWKQRRNINRGFNESTKTVDALQLDAMLEFITLYAPDCLYCNISNIYFLHIVWQIIHPVFRVLLQHIYK